MKKLSLEYAKDMANTKNGKCLSDAYFDSTKKLVWECSNNHIWSATLSSINRGSWCPVCSRKKTPKFTIDMIRNFAKNKNGECISEKIYYTTDILQWKCEKGHIWKAAFSDIKRGGWCPLCSIDKNRKFNIEYCNYIASEYFGKCLSTKYKNTKTKMNWRCELGHVWQATLGNIKDNNSWCPECCQSYGESKFKEELEAITGYKFTKIRPNWLLNDNNNKMEIDGFNPELKMGFEYQGRQHFEFIPLWHKTQEAFEKQIKSDELKYKILNDLGIKMFYPNFKLKPIEYKKYIQDTLTKYNI